MDENQEAATPVQIDADWLRTPAAKSVFDALNQNGHEARAVGGAVRNTLLNLPATDIDIATTARPDDVIALAERAHLKVVPTGFEHGTVTIVSQGKPFEVTTLRNDIETFGRHAKVSYTTDWAEDAKRRDFTLNAIYMSADGRVHDPIGGYQDLLARRIRFIGDSGERIREDYLRILRFFRFNAQFGRPPIDWEGLSACVREHNGLSILSRERIRLELLKLLEAERAVWALETMFEYGLLVILLGAVPQLSRLRRLAEIEKNLELAADPVLRLAVLAVRVVEDSEYLADRFRLSNNERRLLRELSETAPQLASKPPIGQAKAVLYRLGSESYRKRVLFSWTASGDCTSDNKWKKLFGLPDEWEVPVFPLNGDDVLSLGVESGPSVGNLLAKVERWWIDAGFPDNRDTLLSKLRDVAK